MVGKLCKNHSSEINEARMQWVKEQVGGMKTKTSADDHFAESLTVMRRKSRVAVRVGHSGKRVTPLEDGRN